MEKKFGTFLFIALALCAVLLLMATGSRERYRAPEGETTAPAETTGPAETTTPVTTEAIQSSQETTDLNEEVSETPQSTEPAAQAAPASDARSRVEEILDRNPPVKTATTRRVYDADLHGGNTTGLAEKSHAYALAELAQERSMNPVSAFWELVSEGLYTKQKDQSGKLAATAFTSPAQAAKEYAYTAEGARQLLTDLLALAARMEDGLDLELALLGANLAVESEQVHLSSGEGCRYAYFSCASDRATYILCFYLRGGEKITDVEFQLLYMEHASGEAAAVAEMDTIANRQAASLMTAAELLMTGKTRAASGDLPFDYEVGGFDAALERFHFNAENEDGSLTNYRLRKA